jgi:hypothetical protein
MRRLRPVGGSSSHPDPARLSAANAPADCSTRHRVIQLRSRGSGGGHPVFRSAVVVMTERRRSQDRVPTTQFTNL